MATRHESINEGFAREDFGWDLPDGVTELAPEKLARVKAQRLADNQAAYNAGLEKARLAALQIARKLETMKITPGENTDFAKQVDWYEADFARSFADRIKNALDHLDNL